eukprot:CAMPEP_0182862760 /NCGR_PEP_ID=MMETSP0034_2-20130328/6257_1 /TAXON_ID=156128 /ORGANISM="Nephroselmis pyriformis, Strain CCMP717" /LENGTH=123 /DNA_ID=CAMNT_0024994877 /DNA_START=328 /DNA_END=696 /DNA_ORIENTATION=-
MRGGRGGAALLLACVALLLLGPAAALKLHARRHPRGGREGGQTLAAAVERPAGRGGAVHSTPGQMREPRQMAIGRARASLVTDPVEGWTARATGRAGLPLVLSKENVHNISGLDISELDLPSR